MRKIIIIFYLMIVCNFLNAQDHYVDSIQKELSGNIHDTIKAISLMRIAVHYEAVDTAKAALYYRKAIDFAKDKKMDYKTAVIYQNQGYLFMNSGRYDAAGKSLDTALLYAKKSTHPSVPLFTVRIKSGFSTLNRYRNNYKEAVRYQLAAIDGYKNLKLIPNIVNGYVNLSNIYNDMDDLPRQQEAAENALAFAKSSGNTKDYFRCYTILMYALTSQSKYKEATPFLDSAAKYYHDDEEFAVLISYNLSGGLLEMSLENLPAARNHFEKSLAIAEQMKSPFSIIQSKLQLARVLTLEKNFSKAEPMLLKVYKEANESGVVIQTNTALNYLSKLYEEKGDYKQALDYYKQYKLYYDSITNEKNTKYTAGLEVTYNTKEKENHIKQLEAEKKLQLVSIERKNLLNILLLVAAIVIIIFSLLLYRNNNNRQKLQQQRISELETEKKLTATEAVLKGEEQERARLAKDLHDGLGGMLSGIKYSLNAVKGNLIMTPENAQAFGRSIDMLDSSIHEMRRVAHNMMPEALVKFGLDTALKDFCNDINQTGALKVTYQSIGLEKEQIEQTTAITIYRIVQELVNNAIKHAKATNAIVQVTKTNTALSITVEDDGKGFDTTILQQSNGMGWSNMQNRVDFLKGKLDVHSSAKGTSILIEINT